jgi:uncharacterized protein (TIGR01777 family)
MGLPEVDDKELSALPYQHDAVFEHSLDDVFAWHARPGALTRLLPPWQPVTAVKEAESLRDGTAVLALPGGLKLQARHDPAGYQEGRRFTDVLAGPLLSPLVGWRHSHLFLGEPGGGSRVTDTVDTRVPHRFLDEMFAYRTSQLRDDLAAQARWRPEGGRPLTVAVTGSSGLVGSALTALLTTAGHRVVRLVRREPTGSDRLWQPDNPAGDLLDGVDSVVHLAGESIAGQFTASHKDAMRSSRVEPTRRLADLAAKTGVGVFVSASAIGFYGPDRGDEELTEDSRRGEGFLADLVADWEQAALRAAATGGRVVTVRTGIVQSPRGGALRLLRPLFEAGLGGPVAGGRSWMSWIGIDDLAEIYLRALIDAGLDGPVNAAAPEPVRNLSFTKVLARVLHRPAVLPVPGLGPRLLLGREGAAEVALANQRVIPARLTAVGHRFRHPDIESALRHVLGRALSS